MYIFLFFKNYEEQQEREERTPFHPGPEVEQWL